LTALYPRWSRLDEEAAYVSAWIGLAELALGGCTTTTDHLYVHPRGGGDLISAEIRAAVELACASTRPEVR
jgi:cytosine/adenosine deaminase-related metal-dependent hydrolase